jgi:general secretion pathway protein N
MMRNVFVSATLLLLFLHAAAAAKSTGSDDALDAGLADDARAAGLPGTTAVPAAPPVTAVRVVAPPTAPAPERTLSANPLWAIPLIQLSATRERPIFSPSRRPPPAAVAAEPAIVKPPPVRKREPEVPQLALVGTIASDQEGFGIFLDQSTKGALRLKLGEDFQGWRLRAIRGREVTMEKDQQAAVLTLPPPGAAQPSGEVRLLPASVERTQASERH